MVPKINTVLAPALIASLITLLVFLRALFCDFVNLDDPDYVLNNPLIRLLDWDLLVRAFSQAHVGWWMPLTWISFAIDYHFWGFNPVGYHLTNIILHAGNTALVVLIADRLLHSRLHKEETSSDIQLLYPLTLLFAGLLFGIHPLRVESVVWVTERKDVLNGLFSLSSILFYLQYVTNKKSSGLSHRHSQTYLLSLCFFALSLMAKSVSVVIPAMLLVIDWFPLGRLRKRDVVPVIIEKLPFLSLSVLISIFTFYITAQNQYLVSYDVFPLGQRIIVSGNAFFEYCRLLVFPAGMLPFYMIPDPIPASFAIKTSITLLITCSCIALGRKYPAVCVTWLGFLLPLLPVMAFFQNGDQALAARFTYLPSLSTSIFTASLLFAYAKKTLVMSLRAVTASVLILLVIYISITIKLITVWYSSESLWTRVIEYSPDVISYKERGKLYYQAGNYPAAIEDFSKAIDIATGVFKNTIYNLYALRGEAYYSAGLYGQAIQDFSMAISLLPHQMYFYHRGLAYEKLGKKAAAEEDYRRAGQQTGPIVWYDLPGKS